jgi:hypothetical protein
MLPSLPPGQLMLNPPATVGLVALAVSTVGCVMFAVAVAWHPFASVTVTV